VGLVRHVKQGWMAFASRFGRIQTALLLLLVYALVIGPLALVLRVIGRQDLLELRRPAGPSFAHRKQQVPTDRERCERPF
jgi:hypothetical protein